MKHRRGIDLTASFGPSDYREHESQQYETLKSLHEWEVLGAKCGKCGRVSWLDKRVIEREFGNQYLMNLRRKLRCVCGNKEGNTVLIGKLPR
ncbi:hypothetical protein [Ciceribacter thiooxidans]|uniref:Uncharacterized protein n=1 Tax=Ciceribacter thiooxidans TaxID=1969821 RepID=A0ABV7HZ30_9HYPH|nr:hypothetical protein [Ciceribacter thiooxidans]